MIESYKLKVDDSTQTFQLSTLNFLSRSRHKDGKCHLGMHGWDGEWFRRAYDDFGRVLGSQENEEGQIFIEPQGVCVMAGLGIG